MAFATDIHRDRRIFGWLDKAVLTYDVVAVGGDLDDPFGGLPNFKFNYVMHKLRPNVVRDRILAMGSINKKSTRQVLVVLGNHDNPDPRALHGMSVEAGGLLVGGVGGSLPTGPFPFQLEEAQYESVLKKLGHVDILVAHQPPYGTKCDVSFTGAHVGSKAIRDYLDQEQPRLVLTGHVHESPAVDQLGGTTVMNPGPFFSGNYGTVELTEEGVRATIREVAT